jgi:hypothetical protein
MGSVIRMTNETTHGTIGTNFLTVPCAFNGKLNQKNIIRQEARAGQDTQFGIQGGANDESWDVSDSAIYHDTFGLWLSCAMAAPTKVVLDTSGFTNTWLLGDDPKSFSAQWDQPHRSTSPFQMLYGVVDELTISFDINGELTYSAKGAGMPETVIGAPTYSFSTIRPFPVWDATITKGGSGFANLIKGKITIKRNRKPFHAFNTTQAPTKMTIGDRLVTFELDIDFAATSEYTQFKNATTDVLVVQFLDTGGALVGAATAKPRLVMTMSKCGYTEAEIDDSGDLPAIKVKGGAMYNTTDSSAIKITMDSTIDYTTKY